MFFSLKTDRLISNITSVTIKSHECISNNLIDSHLNSAIIGGSGQITIIGGETAVVHWLTVTKHGVLGGRLVQIPSLKRKIAM